MIQQILSILQLFLTSANILILIYAFLKFINRPHDTLEGRISAAEVEIKDIKQSLRLGNDKFSTQEKTNEVLIRSTFALIEFEIQYCLTEHKEMSKGLEDAKENLNRFLSGHR